LPPAKRIRLALGLSGDSMSICWVTPGRVSSITREAFTISVVNAINMNVRSFTIGEVGRRIKNL
jgi:hypothetical protein